MVFLFIYKAMTMGKLTKDRLTYLNGINKVDLGKVDSIKQCLENLINQIESTYLGDEHLTTKYNKIKHFDWCWKTVTNQDIEDDDDYYTFREFFMEHYYNVTPKTKFLIVKLKKFWDTYMNTCIQDTETYEIFLVNYKKLSKIID